MADISVKIPPLGGRIGFFEFDLEEAASSSGQFVKESASDIFDLFKQEIAGVETQPPKSGFPAKGGIEFQKPNPRDVEESKKREEAQYQRVIFSSLEEARKNVQYFAHEQVLADLARLEIGGMPTDEKNKALRLSLDYDEKHINDPYHIHALRVKKMEEIKAALQKKEEQEVATVIRNPNLLNKNAQEGNSLIANAIYTVG